jgi:UDP-GlcNAc:undecaprenyl-phosphate GlcNAc-1-phosphate transferase
MQSNAFILIFALAFMGCVLSTPTVTRLARWAGAIDRPDRFRRVHKGSIPRLGGLGLGIGLAVAILPVWFGGYLTEWTHYTVWWSQQRAIVLAACIVLSLGAIDDTRGVGPRAKLLGQAVAVLVLILGGIQIKDVSILGHPLNLSYPVALELFHKTFVVDVPSIAVTMLWFLGCMNVWNLIDGMDGLASGVGLLVSGTLMLVALHQENDGAAALAAALAGSLAGFLLYNWHPACIFLGDSGSLLIGMLIGVIGVQDSMKGTATVSILFPILAMGLPISDTAMAIFRRWVRNLPLSSADRRHIHHLLLGLGLSPREAAFYLYAFTAFLCGVVLLGVALNNPVQGETLAVMLAGSGILAFLLILTSRRDELGSLLADLKGRFARKEQERSAAKATWDAIQRVELCENPNAIWDVVWTAAQAMGCDSLRIVGRQAGQHFWESQCGEAFIPGSDADVSGTVATFRINSGAATSLTVSLRLSLHAELEPDIAFRALQRLSEAVAGRLERLLAEPVGENVSETAVNASVADAAVPPKVEPRAPHTDAPRRRWIKWGPGWLGPSPVSASSHGR